eukprot:gene7601-754_t
MLHCFPLPAFEWVETSGEAIDDVIDEPVLLMKVDVDGCCEVDVDHVMQVDVEGHEVAAMESAARLMSMHGVDNIVLEYNPHVAEASNDSALLSKNIGMIKGFLTSGYRIAHGFKARLHHKLPGHSEPFKKVSLMEVLDGSALLATSTYFLTPKKFQLVGKMNLTGSVGHLEFDEDARKTWISKKYMDTGLAGIPCSIVEKSNLVLWRCKCSNMTKCGAEEMEVIDLLAEGKFQHLYEL